MEKINNRSFCIEPVNISMDMKKINLMLFIISSMGKKLILEIPFNQLLNMRSLKMNQTILMKITEW